MVKKIDENEFVKIKDDEFAIVDFAASWCGPCRMLAPVIEEVSEEYAERVAFYSLDVDECPNLSQKFGIMSVPFVGMFKKGELIANNIGFAPKEVIKEFIEKNLR